MLGVLKVDVAYSLQPQHRVRFPCDQGMDMRGMYTQTLHLPLTCLIMILRVVLTDVH